jgi:hypothetical protein
MPIPLLCNHAMHSDHQTRSSRARKGVKKSGSKDVRKRRKSGFVRKECTILSANLLVNKGFWRIG